MKWLDRIRRFLTQLQMNSTMLTCPYFWEIYAVEPHCEGKGCPWRDKCPFVEEGLAPWNRRRHKP